MTQRSMDKNKVILDAFIEKLRPEDLEIRKELDFGYSYENQTVVFYEITPDWQDNTNLIKMEFAKLRYYQSRDEWNLYWMRASGNWERYEPLAESKRLNTLLAVISEDSLGCFFG